MNCDCCGEDCGPTTRHEDLTEGEVTYIGATCEALGAAYVASEEVYLEEVPENEWNWERDGFCIIPESRFSGFTGHWAIRSVVVNDDELGIPPLQTVAVEEIPELA